MKFKFHVNRVINRTKDLIDIDSISERLNNNKIFMFVYNNGYGLILAIASIILGCRYLTNPLFFSLFSNFSNLFNLSKVFIDYIHIVGMFLIFFGTLKLIGMFIHNISLKNFCNIALFVIWFTFSITFIFATPPNSISVMGAVLASMAFMLLLRGGSKK